MFWKTWATSKHAPVSLISRVEISYWHFEKREKVIRYRKIQTKYDENSAKINDVNELFILFSKLDFFEDFSYITKAKLYLRADKGPFIRIFLENGSLSGHCRPFITKVQKSYDRFKMMSDMVAMTWQRTFPVSSLFCPSCLNRPVQILNQL